MATELGKIGVIADAFKLELRENLLKAKEVGADGVQIWATEGVMDPDNLGIDRRLDLKEYLAGLGLEVSALCADFGGNGFQSEQDNIWKIEKSKKILTLALELGTPIVTTHIGIVPEDTSAPEYAIMQKACNELAAFASELGGYFAIETGPEPAARLKQFLDSLDSKGVAVNFDPANMVMVTGDDPVQGVYTLRDYIVHTHVKDGIRTREVNPHDVYGNLNHEQIAAFEDGSIGFQEVALGEGSVDFKAYFAALQDIGYTGYLTIEREVGNQPEQDIRQAVEFIQGFKAKV
ncbi:sugar phosphate isomerase/epimerase family protein [Paenibacillus wulumuqiensis]|uniref:sugar phosphate isomerase/epimerase family protein n=1 Tax=Paenibacillus wulumuqiensis TaxID=1567107 RepID=UPI000619A7BA|nr:sugar phosphate isomerase/epimerase family protein [Paenibacillus wulumuqiensis]